MSEQDQPASLPPPLPERLPDPLPYARVRPAMPVAESPVFGREFWLGLGVGVAISVATWGFGFQALINHGSGRALLWVPGFKIVTAVTLLCFARWRSLGLGLMMSLTLGALIFFGNCLANLK